MKMQKNNIKVSIIVPVYNVEKYLDKCILSLVNQTYKNIEILLIDDGSTDLSGVMCDDYARQYSNIKAFHKKNGGLSSARNFGMQYVTGQYVAFVDSDDYVESYYIERLINPILDSTINSAIDMVICNHINESPDGRPLGKGFIRQSQPEYMTAQTALEAMCYGYKFGASACEKIISEKIARSFPFPEGKIYEDLATMFYMIAASKNIVFLGTPMYHYVQRNYSIRRSAWTSSVTDIIDAAQSLLSYISTNYPSIYDAGAYRFFIAANEYYLRAFYELDYINLINNVRSNLKLLWPNIAKNRSVNTLQKIRCWMMAYTPQLYRILYRLYRKTMWA